MGFESTVPLTDHVVDKSEIKTSQVVSCDSTVVEEVKNSLSEEPFLQVPLENKEDTESLGTICDPENNKGDVAEAIIPRGDVPELSISSKVSDDILSLGCETPRESIFDPFAPGPEEAACAPKKKVIRDAEVLSRRQLNFDSGDYKVIRGAEVLSRRQLNFDLGDYPAKRLSFDWSDSEGADQYLQVIHKMILDLFISDGSLDQEEEIEKNLIDSSPHESCKTPVSKPLLTGIATTCPDAPLRPSLKVLKLSPSICRKIDFDSVSPRSSVAKDNN